MSQAQQLLDQIDRRLFDATKGTPAVHDAARLVAALRSTISFHAPRTIFASGGNDDERCAACGADPKATTTHPDVEDADDGSYLCETTIVGTCCEYCYDPTDAHLYDHSWPCPPIRTITDALEGRK